MAEGIRALFFDPPVVIARLGGSEVPQDAYTWAQTQDPHIEGETVVEPAWSLAVRPDASVAPFKPTALRFRDGDNIRPVAPFVELWALVGDEADAPETWKPVPVTPSLLASSGVGVADLTFRVDAVNRKAERRTRNPAHRFGTFPAVEIAGDDHAVKPLEGTSPPGANPPMIPVGDSIPFGSVQVLRSIPQPAVGEADWVSEVDVSLVRVRFTPGKGVMYGPPQATQASPPAVPLARAFLDPAAGWFNAAPRTNPTITPADTFDDQTLQPQNPSTRSLGVVDDTCEARLDVVLRFPGGRELRTDANIFVGPPDYAPDRRPFLSAADEINDRSADSNIRTGAMTDAERTRWVEDFFERVFETVSLLNVDAARFGRQPATTLASPAVTPIPDDHVTDVNPNPNGQTPEPPLAMGSLDRLRNPLTPIAAVSGVNPLPVSEHARARHRSLSDALFLRDFIADNPTRMDALIRPPFAVSTEEAERGGSSMRMPPFMMQSDGSPLSITFWQHALIMDWVQKVLSGGILPQSVLEARAAASPVSAAAEARRAAVLATLPSPVEPQ